MGENFLDRDYENPRAPGLGGTLFLVILILAVLGAAMWAGKEKRVVIPNPELDKAVQELMGEVEEAVASNYRVPSWYDEDQLEPVT